MTTTLLDIIKSQTKWAIAGAAVGLAVYAVEESLGQESLSFFSGLGTGVAQGCDMGHRGYHQLLSGTLPTKLQTLAGLIFSPGVTGFAAKSVLGGYAGSFVAGQTLGYVMGVPFGAVASIWYNRGGSGGNGGDDPIEPVIPPDLLEEAIKYSHTPEGPYVSREKEHA